MEREGVISTGSGKKRKREERVRCEDSRGEVCQVHNSHVTELNTVIHFPSFVADLDKKIHINRVCAIIQTFQGCNGVELTHRILSFVLNPIN